MPSDDYRTTLRILSNKPFLALVGGQFISQLGNAAYNVALPWAVYQATGDFLKLSSVVVVLTTTKLGFGWLGGVVADRFSRRALVALADIGRGVAVSVTALLLWVGVGGLWPLWVLALLFGIGESLFNPAYFGLIPALVRQEDLRRANAIVTALRTTTVIAGPLVGGIMLSRSGATLVLFLDGISFFLAAAAVALLPPIRPPGPSQRAGILSDAREGIRYLIGASVLWAPLITLFVTSPLSDAPWSILLPKLLSGLTAGGGALTYGAALAAFGFGVIVGSFLMAGRVKGSPRAIYFVATLVAGLVQAGIGLVGGANLIVGLAVILGAAVGVIRVSLATLVQSTVSAAFLGRMQSLMELGSMALLPVAYAGVGALAGRFGAEAVFLVSGLIICLTTIVTPLLFPARATEVSA